MSHYRLQPSSHTPCCVRGKHRAAASTTVSMYVPSTAGTFIGLFPPFPLCTSFLTYRVYPVCSISDMAEAVIAVGLAGSVVQLIDYSSKIVKQMRSFSSNMENLPSAFRNVQITLPLILDILKRTKQQIDFREINHETQTALQPLLEGCTLEVQRLEDLLAGLLPKISDSPFKRTSKAVLSVLKEKRIEAIASALQKFLQVLTCHQVSPSAVPAALPSKALFMVPFPKDSTFVGREGVLKAMRERFRDEGNVALAGIGGVGSVSTLSLWL